MARTKGTTNELITEWSRLYDGLTRSNSGAKLNKPRSELKRNERFFSYFSVEVLKQINDFLDCKSDFLQLELKRSKDKNKEENITTQMVYEKEIHLTTIDEINYYTTHPSNMSLRAYVKDHYIKKAIKEKEAKEAYERDEAFERYIKEEYENQIDIISFDIFYDYMREMYSYEEALKFDRLERENKQYIPPHLEIEANYATCRIVLLMENEEKELEFETIKSDGFYKYVVEVKYENKEKIFEYFAFQEFKKIINMSKETIEARCDMYRQMMAPNV